MADWYVSQAAWAALPQFVASAVYTVGQIVRPLTAPAFSSQCAYRCTVAGTAGAEPTWSTASPNNGTTVTGGVTFTNVTGQSTYGWGAAAGNLYSVSYNAPGGSRPVAGDRVFLASDHSESSTSLTYEFGASGFGVIEFISVNRAGNVPPQAADVLAGASITITTAVLNLDPFCNYYWQGVTFTAGGTATAIQFGSSGLHSNYFKNCSFVFTTSSTTAYIGGPANPVGLTFDNCSVNFNVTTQRIYFNATGYPCDFKWINTPTPLPGSAPAVLFTGNSTASPTTVTCRGVDFSAVTGTLYSPVGGQTYGKLLLDSCKIAPGVVRLATPGNNPADEVELVNCFDGTNILNERDTQSGTLTTDRATMLVGGAADDVGLFSHRMVSSMRSDGFVGPLDSFWLDVENTLVGSAHTATVEIAGGGSLNNNDIWLVLEYMGTAGSPIATFVSTQPATPLTTPSAVPTSTAIWSATTWNPSDLYNTTLSGGNLTAVGNPIGSVRSTGPIVSGKYYFEYTFVTGASTGSIAVGIANASANLSNAASTGVGAALYNGAGGGAINGTAAGSSIGAATAGTVYCVAVDFGAQLIWFRNGAAGNWNGSGTANPATGAGGLSFSSLGAVGTAFYGFAGFTSAGTSPITANFGASGFTGAVPTGFTSGLAGASVTQHLQASFTPQMAGRVRGQVKLGKVSTTVWVNPQITIT